MAREVLTALKIAASAGAEKFLGSDGAGVAGWESLTSGQITTALGYTPLKNVTDTLTGRLIVSGVGQAVANLSTSSSIDGATFLQDTGGGAGNGGMAVFGATQGYWAAIKGMLVDGGGNSKGSLIFATRSETADATLTEKMRLSSTFGLQLATPTPTSGTGLMLRLASAYDVTVPTGLSASMISFAVRNRATATADSLVYGINITTEADGIDNAAGIAVFNNGKGDSIFLGVPGKSGAVGTNGPTGLGIDLNKLNMTTENSSTFAGYGVHIFDWSTTNIGSGAGSSPTAVFLKKYLNPDTDHILLRLLANRGAIKIHIPEGGGYDGTKDIIRASKDSDDSERFSVQAVGSAVIRGVGQAVAAMSTSSGLGGSLRLNDTGGGASNGGAIIFGATQGYWAAIKGLLTDGSSNTQGHLIFATRAATADAALTERWRIQSNGHLVGVAGAKVFTAGLEMTTSPTTGYVLTSDTTGNATWQAAPAAPPYIAYLKYGGD